MINFGTSNFATYFIPKTSAIYICVLSIHLY